MKKKYYPNILQSFGIVGIFILFSILFYPFIPTSHIINLDAELLMMIYYLLVAGSTFLLAFFIKKKISGEVNIDFSTKAKETYFFLALASVSILFLSGTVANLIPMPDSFKEIIIRMAGQTGIFTFIYFVLLAPIFEELIFRGIMLDGMLKQYSAVKSIIWSSIFFGIVHLNPWQFVTAFFIGCFSGWVYYRTKSIIPCIVIHMSANGAGYILRLFISAGGTNDSLTGLPEGFPLWGSIVFASGLVVVSIYLLNKFLPS